MEVLLNISLAPLISETTFQSICIDCFFYDKRVVSPFFIYILYKKERERERERENGIYIYVLIHGHNGKKRCQMKNTTKPEWKRVIISTTVEHELLSAFDTTGLKRSEAIEQGMRWCILQRETSDTVQSPMVKIQALTAELAKARQEIERLRARYTSVSKELISKVKEAESNE